MKCPDVLIIGGGPAGLACANVLAQVGLYILLVEQRDQLGGAINRVHIGTEQSTLKAPSRHKANWIDQLKQLNTNAKYIQVWTSTIFLGVDQNHQCLLDRREKGHVQGIKPRALVLALGAQELIFPKLGWELPGVVTVGAMQVQLKETGRAPEGDVLIAGSGALPIALAAQLCRVQRPPVAVIEAGKPILQALRNLDATWSVLKSKEHFFEVLEYAWSLIKSLVPYKTGWQVLNVEPHSQRLKVTLINAVGKQKTFIVDHLALHDGLIPNNAGLPVSGETGALVIRAGDCQEILGADGALIDGKRVAVKVAQHLGKKPPVFDWDPEINKARCIQTSLGVLFKASSISTPAQVVLCRCEGLKRSDLDQLKSLRSARELRLVGRYAMGLCQGRFCALAVQKVAAQSEIYFDKDSLLGRGQRWPLRPVSVTALAAYKEKL